MILDVPVSRSGSKSGSQSPTLIHPCPTPALAPVMGDNPDSLATTLSPSGPRLIVNLAFCSHVIFQHDKIREASDQSLRLFYLTSGASIS